ncbi:hypothetical protein B0H11DRAFT_2133273 [Mycena galericulata]|nr:hypothetical protein B0H11DRAFT_2133273 [Mycena galericulata]
MSGKSRWRNAESNVWTGTRTNPLASVSAAPRRKMEHIASVSRSSGLEKDGDALRDCAVQEEYRQFIQGKLNELWERYPRLRTETETETRRRVDAQENLLILFRKLREGVVSSKRVGQFTMEVYETSLCLAVLFDSPRHISTIIPALITYLHLPSTEACPNCVQAVLVCLLYHLVAAYPSQREFHAFLDSVPKAFFPDTSAARAWIKSLAAYIRARNYAKIDRLTQMSALPINDQEQLSLEQTLAALSLSSGSDAELPKKAFFHLVGCLRSKTRDMAWTMMRVAYRELSCQADPQLDTRVWLERSLGLLSGVPGGHDIPLEEWLERESGLGHIKKKDGIDGRWILCKPR